MAMSCCRPTGRYAITFLSTLLELWEYSQFSMFTYSIAGVEIETNRAVAEMSARGYTDIAASVIFCMDNEVVPRQDWQLLPGGHANLPAHISADGKQVIIWEAPPPDSRSDYAREIRRVVPFISALQQQIIL